MATSTIVATEDLRTEALGRIRDYTDPEGINHRANALHARNAETYAAMRAVNADFEHLIKLSDDYDEILAAALAAVDSIRMFNAAEKIGAELRRHVTDARVERPTYYPDATKPALEFLDGQLREVMRVVRDQEAPLKGISDSRAALRAGGAAQDAWAELEDQVDRYDEIRRVQRTITINLSGEDRAQWHRQVLDRSGILRAAFDHSPLWISSRIAAYRTGSRDLERGEDAWVEWVKDTPDFPAAASGDDPIANLRWLAAGDKAWVPDMDELMRVDQLAEDMLGRSSRVADRIQAREEYYTARGLEPSPGRGPFQDAKGRITTGSFE